MAHKLEAGQGGKLGHTNMVHYDGKFIRKKIYKTKRRQQGKQFVRKALQCQYEKTL